MEIVLLIAGIALGGVIIWFYTKSKQGNIPDVKLYEQEINNLKSELTVTRERLQEAEKQKASYAAQLNVIKEQLEKQLAEANNEKNELKVELRSEREKGEVLNTRISKAEEVFQIQKQKIAELSAEKEELNKKLTSEFENIANRILDEKSQKFTEQNKANLDVVLNPLKERIKDFEAKVDKAYKEESNERVSLKKEIEQLINLNKQVSEEANNLAKALKGDTKKQGNWGEVMLERILENSGLRKEEEYKTQVSFTDDTGLKKPDVVVFLPDNKHIIIDAKVSLIAYEQAVNADDEEGRKLYIKAHVESVRNHIKLLSDKNYQNANMFNSPEFVLMFVPIESMFGAAIQADVDLFNFAWDKKIVIVSPSTLLATLKTIASIWKQERQNRNALQIAEESGKLYDKFIGFVDDLEAIGKSIDSSNRAYNDAFNKLKTGKGNIIRRIENIKELGAKTTKSIPEKYIEKDDLKQLPFEE